MREDFKWGDLLKITDEAKVSFPDVDYAIFVNYIYINPNSYSIKLVLKGRKTFSTWDEKMWTKFDWEKDFDLKFYDTIKQSYNIQHAELKDFIKFIIKPF